ncbi:MAG: NAD-binding protein [Victivallaceae bacterium]|nr:NAD-binding protein [Victivallaceae bacterium]
MKVIILGAGELGRYIGKKLSADRKHEVILVDIKSEIDETIEALPVIGDGASVRKLKEAGAENADLLLALSGNEDTNALACHIAKKLGIKRTICRIFSDKDNMFPEANGLYPKDFGIDEVLYSVTETVDAIDYVLENEVLVNYIPLRHKDAKIVVINKMPINSEITGYKLKDLAGKLNNMRIAAVVRDGELIVPDGDTQLKTGDRIYVAGMANDARRFVNWLFNEGSKPISNVVVAGASKVSEELMKRLRKRKCDLKLICSNQEMSKQAIEVPEGVITLSGDVRDTEIMNEACINGCDVFIALDRHDEVNIISCLLAKKYGAKKVIALTSKNEYIDILPVIDQMGCRINSTQILASRVFQMLDEGPYCLLPRELNDAGARLGEFQLTDGSDSFVGKCLRECKFPPQLQIALIVRDDGVHPSNGDLELKSGDFLYAIAKPETIEKFSKMI